MDRPTLAIDIGGTKIAVGLVDADGALRHVARQRTPQADGERIWVVVADLIRTVLAQASGAVRGVGIACAGPMDLDAGTVSPLNMIGWRAFPLVARTRAVVPGVPVRLANDAVCVALGEHWRGAGRGARFMLGMVVSTGVGGGLVLDGAPYAGRTGNAGHVGHVVVELDGPPCPCGGRGCAEAIASGPSMLRWARAQGWQAAPDAGGAQLAAAAEAGDPVAQQAFRRSGTAIAAMIASVAAVCDLDLAVVGGGVADAGALLFDPLHAALAQYARLDFLRDLRVVPAQLGADAGLIGAAALVT
jgi:glucokinase